MKWKNWVLRVIRKRRVESLTRTTWYALRSFPHFCYSPSFSQSLNLFLRRTSRSWFKQSGKRRVRKSFSNFLLESRYTFTSISLGCLIYCPKITEDQAALRQVMRLRGFSLMHNILEDHAKDIDITIAVSGCFQALVVTY